MKLKKGTKIAHIIAGNVVPTMLVLKMDENVPEGVAGKTPKKKQPTQEPSQ